MSDKPYKCNSCYKCFESEASLLEHIPKHKETKHLKTHICTICGKSYTQDTYLTRHMAKHFNERGGHHGRGLHHAGLSLDDVYIKRESEDTSYSNNPLATSHGALGNHNILEPQLGDHLHGSALPPPTCHGGGQAPSATSAAGSTHPTTVSAFSPIPADPNNSVVNQSASLGSATRTLYSSSMAVTPQSPSGGLGASNPLSGIPPMSRGPPFPYPPEPLNFGRKGPPLGGSASSTGAVPTMPGVRPNSMAPSWMPNQLLSLQKIQEYSLPATAQSSTIASGRHSGLSGSYHQH
jgi:hypothetical protein